jgi:hypothetical protein
LAVAAARFFYRRKRLSPRKMSKSTTHGAVPRVSWGHPKEATMTETRNHSGPDAGNATCENPRKRLPPVLRAARGLALAVLVLLSIGWVLHPKLFLMQDEQDGRESPEARFLDHPGESSAGKGGETEIVVYTNDFERPLGSSFPEWSSSPIAFSNRFGLPVSGTRAPDVVTNVESPNGKRRFLGEFGGPRLDPTARTRVQQTVRLALKDLAPHTRATVAFDLMILKSWDGSSPRYGPDRFCLRVKDGPVLLDTTFSNNPKLKEDQSFQDFPRAHGKPQAGASAVRTLGYTFFGDSTYHLSFTFPHTAGVLVLDFASDLFEGKGTQDESWGLDNVTMTIGNEPEAPL